MSSSDGGGGNPGLLAMGGVPMGGLPIAGTGPIDPSNYGKFQNFLPDIKAEGPNDMATGLRPDMFKYRSPNGDVASGGGGGSGGLSSTDVQGLRDLLAKVQSGSGGGGIGMPSAGETAGGGAPMSSNSIGTMGLGGGGIPGMGGGGGGGYPLGGQGVADLVAGQTPFSAWGGNSNDTMFRRGVQQGPIDWRAKDAAAAAAAAKPPEGG